MSDACTFVAVSNTTAKVCSLDNTGKPAYIWQETSGQLGQGSVNWLRNGKAFLTTHGGSVAAHVVEALKDKEKPPIILSLPSGPLISRVSGDGKCLVVVQSSVPGSINVYDLQSLLGSASGNPAKPPVILQDHDRPILSVAASSSTTHIASSNSIGAVYLHEAGSGGRSTIGPLAGGPMLMTPKRCLAFSQLNKPLRLAAGADDGQVLVWQITPMASGPVVMPNKLRGRVMGVGFAAYNKVPSSVLLACSEPGQLYVTDLRSFPNVQSQASFSIELNVSVSCMVVREDGQMVAVGTKDGRVGLLRVDELIHHRQNVAKAGLIKVFDLGTHLDVVDVAFQRTREHRDSRDANRESKDSAAASTTAPALGGAAQEQAAKQQASPVDAADGRPGSGWVPELGKVLGEEEPPLKKHATYSVLMAAGSVSQRQGPPEKQEVASARGMIASSGGALAANAQHRPQPVSTTTSTGTAGGASARSPVATQPAAPPGGAPITAAGSTGPSGQSGVQQSGASRHPGVPPVVIPSIAPPVGSHRRPSDVGGGNASSSTTPTGGQDEVAGGDGQALLSPAARTLVGGALASTSSPVSSPSRSRSPRATVSGGGYPVARPHGSSGGDAMSAAGLRAYLDDFRQEVRDLVRGLQADMVRQAVAAEMAHRNDVALLQQENRLLWEEVRRLSQQLDANLRFGLLGQQGAPWQ